MRLQLQNNALETLPRDLPAKLMSINIADNPLDAEAKSILELLEEKGVNITHWTEIFKPFFYRFEPPKRE